MIPRYSRPEMARLWEPEAKFRIWLKIETLAAEAMAKLGLIPKSVPEAVKKRGAFDIARIDAIEREVKHDVIAFLTHLAEHVGPEARSELGRHELQAYVRAAAFLAQPELEHRRTGQVDGARMEHRREHPVRRIDTDRRQRH